MSTSRPTTATPTAPRDSRSRPVAGTAGAPAAGGRAGGAAGGLPLGDPVHRPLLPLVGGGGPAEPRAPRRAGAPPFLPVWAGRTTHADPEEGAQPVGRQPRAGPSLVAMSVRICT